MTTQHAFLTFRNKNPSSFPSSPASSCPPSTPSSAIHTLPSFLGSTDTTNPSSRQNFSTAGLSFATPPSLWFPFPTITHSPFPPRLLSSCILALTISTASSTNSPCKSISSRGKPALFTLNIQSLACALYPSAAARCRFACSDSSFARAPSPALYAACDCAESFARLPCSSRASPRRRSYSASSAADARFGWVARES